MKGQQVNGPFVGPFLLMSIGFIGLFMKIRETRQQCDCPQQWKAHSLFTNCVFKRVMCLSMSIEHKTKTAKTYEWPQINVCYTNTIMSNITWKATPLISTETKPPILVLFWLKKKNTLVSPYQTLPI